jgi:hypothetical protein
LSPFPVASTSYAVIVKEGTAKADAPVIDLDETDLDLPF